MGTTEFPDKHTISDVKYIMHGCSFSIGVVELKKMEGPLSCWKLMGVSKNYVSSLQSLICLFIK